MSPKQEIFIAAYVACQNATKAALQAGYSPKTAYKIGSLNLAKPEIADEIARRRAGMLKRYEVTAENLIREAARIAFFDPRKLFDENGRPLPLTELDDDTVAAIAGLDVHEEFITLDGERHKIGEVKKWKIASKLDAIQTLMRHKGMLNDKVDHSGTIHLKAYVSFDPESEVGADGRPEAVPAEG